jgi:hypothetical protein
LLQPAIRGVLAGVLPTGAATAQSVHTVNTDGTPQPAPAARFTGATRADGHDADMIGSRGTLPSAGNPVPNAASDGDTGLVAFLLVAAAPAPGFGVGALDLHLDLDALLLLLAFPLPSGALDAPAALPLLPGGLAGLMVPMQAVFVDGQGARFDSGRAGPARRPYSVWL